MPSKLSCLVGLALLTPLAAIRKRSSKANVTASNDCSSLSDIVIGGRDFGRALEAVCSSWPEGLGEFPLNDIERSRELIEKAMGPGGAWDQIGEIRENRGNRGFCWRNETLRLPGVPGQCEMTSRGTCYGKCPVGYRPGLLAGIFSPACTTGCSASTHTVSCGFGCATSSRECARSILEQAFAVASGVGSVYSFLTGDERIAQVVDAVINLAEFFLAAFPPIAQAIKGAIDILQNNEEGAMIAVILYQYLVEVAPEVGEPAEAIRDAIREFSQIIANLAQERQDKGEVTVGRIIREILDHGERYLDLAVRVTKAFSYAKCAISDDVAFTIENVGDDRLMGPWIQRGTINERPKYILKGDRSTIIEWTYQPAGRWVMFSDGWLGGITRRYLYEARVDTADYPMEGWTILQGSEPTPEFVPFQAHEG